jgi:2'-5' RNA ligase
MRLFVAVDLDAAAREAIEGEQRRVSARMGQAAARLQFVKPAHLHLTLAFVGAADPSQVSAFAAAIGADVPLPSFDVSIAGLGVFPERGAPRVLWLGLSEGARETMALHAVVQARLASLGVEVENRAFHPHLTIARWRDSRPSDRRRALGGEERPLARVRVEEVSLYESRLSPSGATYTRLAAGRLTSS